MVRFSEPAFPLSDFCFPLPQKTRSAIVRAGIQFVMTRSKKTLVKREAGNFTHPPVDMALRPEAGTQPQFKKSKLLVVTRLEAK